MSSGEAAARGISASKKRASAPFEFVLLRQRVHPPLEYLRARDGVTEEAQHVRRLLVCAMRVRHQPRLFQMQRTVRREQIVPHLHTDDFATNIVWLPNSSCCTTLHARYAGHSAIAGA